MGEIIKELLDAPLSNLIIVAGLAFLAIAVVGKISGKIEPGRGGRILAGVLGSGLFVGGLISHMRQHAIPGTQPSAAGGAVQQQAETTAAGAAGTEKSPPKHVHTATKNSGAGAPPKPHFQVRGVLLAADPPAYKGSCPVRVTFTGEIRVTGGAGQVGYQFVNDGGYFSSARLLQFDSAGSHNVQMSRMLGTKGSSGTYAGWEELRILQPQQISSQPAAFHVECTAPALANHIRNFQVSGYRPDSAALAVDYSYTGDHGSTDVFMTATAFQSNGSPVPGQFTKWGNVAVGDGRAAVMLGLGKVAGTYSVSSVRVCMQVGKGKPFYCESFPTKLQFTR